MKGITTYGAVATKIRGMRSHLLTTEDYEKIAACPSVREIVMFLKGHPSYGEVLEELDPDNMRRESFERMILRSVFRDFAKIAHFLDRQHKDLLTVFSVEYELRLLNNLIRNIYNRYSEQSDLSVYRPMYEGSPNFDFDRVIKAKDMDSMINALEGSPYQAPLLKIRKMSDKPTLFDYETAITRFHFSYYFDALKKIDDHAERDVLLEIRGSQIDMLNIVWIYRSKAYYKMTAKEITDFIIPACHKLKPAQIARMAAAPNAEEVLNIVAETRYAKSFDLTDPESMEEAVNAHIEKLNAKTRRDYPYSFAVIGAYAYDKKAEVDRIVRITESVRYGYDPKVILDALHIQR